MRAVVVAAVAMGIAACGDPSVPAGPGVQATTYGTPHFNIVDSAAVPIALIDTLAAALETDWAIVDSLLPDFAPPTEAIVMVIRPGPGLPFIAQGSAFLGQYYGNGSQLSLTYLPHQLTHVWTRYTRGAFMEEGLAVYVTTLVVPKDSRPDPYRAELPHEWTSLFAMKGSAIDLATAFTAANFQFSQSGSSPDASAWQLFVEAGSFTQWVIETFGRAAWLRQYRADSFEGGLGATADQLQQQWFQAVETAYPAPRSCEEALAPLDSRETFWCRRANGQ